MKLKKTMLFRQRDHSDCGAACLAAICAHYGIAASVASIRMLAGTNSQGTSAWGLIEAAKELGLEAEAVKVSMASVHQLQFPAIAHVRIDGASGHFIVLVKKGKEDLVVMDPAEGRFRTRKADELYATWTGVVILCRAATEKSRNVLPTFVQRCKALIVTRTRSLTLIAGMAIASAVLAFSIPLYIKKLIDAGFRSDNNAFTGRATAMVITLLVCHFCVNQLRGWIALRTSRAIDRQLITKYYQHLLGLSQRFFDGMQVGEIVSRVNDAVKISHFFTDVLPDMIMNALVAAFSFMIMATFNWRLSLEMVAAVPVYALLVAWNDHIQVRWQKKLLERSAELNTRLVESITAAATVKRLAVERLFLQKTSVAITNLLEAAFHASTGQLRSMGVADVFTRLLTVACLWWGTDYVVQGKLSPGALIAFFALTGYCTNALLSLMATVRPVREIRAAADRLFDIMDIKVEANGKLTCGNVGRIRFESVCFTYPGGKSVLTDVNLEIHAGSITGIAGVSGSGKSTIAALLQKLYLPQSGGITINGVRIEELDSRWIRKVIAVVPQQTLLFSGTIAENIVIGDDMTDKKKIREICDRMGCLEWIERLPYQFDTPVLEQGGNLSGGERQKICIARALYRQPQLLIMDEATAALDSASEEKVMQALQWYNRQGTTLVIIAHKNSLLGFCDRVVQM